MSRPSLRLTSPNAETTAYYGQVLGRLVAAGQVLALRGDLGAGKTTFVQGFGRGWGVTAPMTSPTFILVRQYERKRDSARLYHLDAYRLSSPADADSIGLEELLAPEHVVLIEWAEHVAHLLPSATLWLDFQPQADESRLIEAQACDETGQSLLTEWATALEKI
jgi:tRNA threonylcarbamoyladenosine biosynthesis protein TsaE